jgi:hypothetical protein
MALKLRASGLGSGIDKDRPDYIVSSGQWDVGRIYQVRGGPENMRWFWSMTVNGPMTRADRVATLEVAKAGVKSPGMRGRLGRSWRRHLNEKAEVAWRLTRYEIRQAQKGAAANRSTDERPERTIGQRRKTPCAPSSQMSKATSASLASGVNVLLLTGRLQ